MARTPAKSAKTTKTAKGAHAAKAKPKPRGRRKRLTKAELSAIERRWSLGTFALIAGVLLVRLGVLAAELVPVHFDEAQYWAYGQELAWGYFSKPPGAAALIRLSTDLLGDTLLGLRIASPLAHAGVAVLMFLTARRIWEARTGFWAAAAYTAAPGVGVSAMLITTDPPMMLAWAVALYALVRAGERGDPRWWAAVGLALGLGMLTKYTMLGFVAGALGYGLFSARGRDWRGLAIAAGVSALVVLPNLVWNLEHGFATLAHVAEDADPGGGYMNPGGFAEFLGAQLGVIGPVIFLALAALLWRRGEWRDDWGMRLMAWQCFALLLPIIGLAFITRAQPNWAAPAYIAGTILAARWLLTRDWRRILLWGQVALGFAATAAVYGLAVIYASGASELPRATDPFKKMRIGEPFCTRALGTMAEHGVEVMLSNNRRRLSECMFLGALDWDRIAVWNPDLAPKNHHELVSTLHAGDSRQMLIAVHGGAREMARQFEEATEIETGRFATHRDREVGFALWLVRGFKGYDSEY